MHKKIFVSIFSIIVLLFISSCDDTNKNEKRTFNPREYKYYDDVAWVQLSENKFFHTEYFGVVCIDKFGTEIFSLPDVNRPNVSNFYNGIALIDGRYMINSTFPPA